MKSRGGNDRKATGDPGARSLFFISIHLTLFSTLLNPSHKSRVCSALTSQIPPLFPADASPTLSFSSFSLFRHLFHSFMGLLSPIPQVLITERGRQQQTFHSGCKGSSAITLYKRTYTHSQFSWQSPITRSPLGTLNSRCFEYPHATYSSYLRPRFIPKAFNWSVG